MVLESTIICVDNSEYMRNGDYIPNRLQAQQDAVNAICRYKTTLNPENTVGLITLSNNAEIVTTLTSDQGKLLTSLHHVQPGGKMNLLIGLRIAHLALKHRGSRSHRMRVVCFVGSPLEEEDRDVIKVGKRLKKESVLVDIVNFGETDSNTKKLELLVDAVNGKDSTASHLVTIPAPCTDFTKALVSSAVMVSEDGGPNPASFASGSFEFGVDPNEDPELAMALRVSMEEQRQRQQEEDRGAGEAAPAAAPAAAAAEEGSAPAAPSTGAAVDEDEMLQQALAMSMDAGGSSSSAAPPAQASSMPPNFASMTEDEQIAYAMQISMQDNENEAMEVDPPKKEGGGEAPKAQEGEKKGGDLSSVMNDAAFLEGVLNSLPGVNPSSDVVKQAIDSYAGGSSSATASEDKEPEKKKKKTDEEEEQKK